MPWLEVLCCSHDNQKFIKMNFYRQQFQNVSMTKSNNIWIWAPVWSTSTQHFNNISVKVRRLSLKKKKNQQNTNQKIKLWKGRKFRSWFLQLLSKIKVLLLLVIRWNNTEKVSRKSSLDNSPSMVKIKRCVSLEH